MADRLYEFPGPDAPLSAWLLPVSATMTNGRAPSSCSSAVADLTTRISGKQLTRRGDRRRENARCQHDDTIRRMAAAGATAPEIAGATGMRAPGVRRAAERLGVVLAPARGNATDV